MSWITKRKTQNGTTQWLYRWSEDGTRKTKVIPDAKTRRQAERIRQQWDWQRSVECEVSKVEECWTLGKARIELLGQKVCSPRYEVELNRHFEKSLFAFFGEDKRLPDIMIGDVRKWIAWRRKQPGRGDTPVRTCTVRHEFYTLSECFQLAVESGKLDANPCSTISLKKILPNDVRRRERVLSPEEIERLIAVCDGHVKTFVVLAWATAGRMSEILQLEWNDIDSANGTITFRHDPPRRRTKNRKTRKIPVARKFLAYVLGHHPKVGGSSWIFSHPDGSRIKNVKTGIKLATRRAGLEGVTAHTIRHSTNSALLAGGFSQTVVRDHVGHSDFRMTSHYAHSQEEEQKAAAEYLATVGSEKSSQTKGFLEGFLDEDVRQKMEQVSSNPEFVSAVESIIKLIKRETGIEPATLSLEVSCSSCSSHSRICQ